MRDYAALLTNPFPDYVLIIASLCVFMATQIILYFYEDSLGQIATATITIADYSSSFVLLGVFLKQAFFFAAVSYINGK